MATLYLFVVERVKQANVTTCLLVMLSLIYSFMLSICYQNLPSMASNDE